jgi:hypothetical protein
MNFWSYINRFPQLFLLIKGVDYLEQSPNDETRVPVGPTSVGNGGSRGIQT